MGRLLGKGTFANVYYAKAIITGGETSESVAIKVMEFVSGEGAIAFLLLIKIGPLRELVIKSLDQMKMGKGPTTVKTIAGTMSVIIFSNLMSIVKIQNKGAKLGTMSPMDHVLWRTYLLEATLLCQFLSYFLLDF